MFFQVDCPRTLEIGVSYCVHNAVLPSTKSMETLCSGDMDNQVVNRSVLLQGGESCCSSGLH